MPVRSGKEELNLEFTGEGKAGQTDRNTTFQNSFFFKPRSMTLFTPVGSLSFSPPKSDTPAKPPRKCLPEAARLRENDQLLALDMPHPGLLNYEKNLGTFSTIFARRGCCLFRTDFDDSLQFLFS